MLRSQFVYRDCNKLRAERSGYYQAKTGKAHVNFLSLDNHLTHASCRHRESRFRYTALVTATYVTKIREAFPDRVTGEERKGLLSGGLSSLSLYLASVRGRLTLTHVHITYDLVMK